MMRTVVATATFLLRKTTVRPREEKIDSGCAYFTAEYHLPYNAPPSLVASVNEAINNGKLKERLLYWADHFDADWADDLAPAAGPANNAMTQLNSGLHGKVGSIEKWLLIVIVVLGAVCLLCCVCCIIHVGTCGIL